MIVGVDHIGWSLSDPASASATLRSLGRTCVFAEAALPTSPAERPLLRSESTTHAIEYWRDENAPAIETIAHPSASARVATLPTVLVPAAALAAPATPDPVEIAALGVVADRVRLSPTRTTVLRARSGAADPVTYVVGVADMERARGIWCAALGARVVAEAAGQVAVRIASRLPQWRLDVVLVPAPGRDDPLALDDEGFLSVGLLTTDLRGDRERLERAGVAMCEPFRMTVNGRALRVAMGRGAGDEIVELIAVA